MKKMKRDEVIRRVWEGSVVVRKSNGLTEVLAESCKSLFART
jgi:hypothetical protein